MKLITNYMLDDDLRHKLNDLTQKTFGFDFEGWVTNGYFEGDYIPFSYMENDIIISNASANIMTFNQNGVVKNYIQIGTVMTDEAYRKQGLARKLIEHILKEYQGKCDGIYLYGDLDALDFYHKVGFSEGLQYRYTLKTKVESTDKESFVKVSQDDAELKARYMNTIRNGVGNSSFDQINRYGLCMFYTADMDNVYYSAELDCFVVMEKWEDTLILQNIFSKNRIAIEDVLTHIGVEYKELRLGFTPYPEDMNLFEATAFDGENDYRLFYIGDELKSIEKERLYFPQLSHA